MAEINNTNCNDHIDDFIQMATDIHSVIKNGYVSDENLTMLISNLEPLLESVIQSKKIIQNNVGLDMIFPAMDHLKIFCDGPDLGSMALVSKSFYDLMVQKYGQTQTELYVLEHYFNHDEYHGKVSNINLSFGNEMATLPIDLNIINQKKLRKLIGPKEYFENNDYLFFKSDIMYLADMFNQGICVELCIPDRICIFCGEIKSMNNTHVNCYKFYVKHNMKLFMHREHNSHSDEDGDDSNFDEDSDNSNSDADSDNFNYNDDNSDYETRTQDPFLSYYNVIDLEHCTEFYPCKRKHISVTEPRKIYCSYLYPELLYFSKKNNSI